MLTYHQALKDLASYSETITQRDAEIERLRAALKHAGHYMALCPPPSEAKGDLRIELLKERSLIATMAAAYEQSAPPEGDNDPNGNRHLAREIDG